MNAETQVPQAPRSGVLASLAVGLLAAIVSLRTVSNQDLWLHLASGREVATHGIQRTDPFSFASDAHAWVQDTWLYDWLIHQLWRAGDAPLVVGLHALMAALAFGLMTRLSRPATSAGVLAGALALWLAAPQLVVRPTLAAFLCTALVATLVRRPSSVGRRLALLLPLQLVWTNVHPTFLMGPALALLAAFDAEVVGRREGGDAETAGTRKSVRGLLMAAAAMLLVTLVNPYGLRLHLNAMRQFIRPGEGWMLEWVSPFVSLFDQGLLAALPTLALVGIALGFVLHRQRLPWFFSVLGVISAFLIVWVPQHIEWCALLALPFLTVSATALGDLVRRLLPERVAAPAYAVLALAASLGTAATFTTSAYYRDCGSASRFGWGVQSDLFPFDAARLLLKEPGFPARVYNLPIDGGALLWARPERKVMIDARSEIYGSAFIRDYNVALRGDQKRWGEITKRWPADAFVFNCCWSGSGSIVRSLLISRQWSIAYFDGTSVVLVPALRRNLGWIRHGPIQQEGLDLLEAERKSYSAAVAAGRHPPNPSRLIGAAAFMQSIGQFREASTLYALLARGSPDMTGAWLNLGICLVQHGDATQAVPILEYARTRLPKHVMVHLWLSRAYRETGSLDLAQASYARAERIDRAVAETFAGIAETNKPTTTMRDGGKSIE